MRDFTPAIQRVQQCPYCKDYKGDPGIIWPEDKLATKQPDGSWKCGKCFTEELQRKMLKTLGLQHPKVQSFLQKEQREVNRWNRYAENLNQAAGYEVMKKQKNKYLQQ